MRAWREAPHERGGSSRELVRLATIPRSNGDEEIRISVDEYDTGDGRPPAQYVSERLWYRDRATRKFRPTTKGLTKRRGELARFIAALTRAEQILTGREPIADVKGGAVVRETRTSSRPAQQSMRTDSAREDESHIDAWRKHCAEPFSRTLPRARQTSPRGAGVAAPAARSRSRRLRACRRAFR